MIGLSPWASTAKEAFTDPLSPEIISREFQNYSFTVQHVGDSLWVIARHPAGNRTALRTAFSPDGELFVSRVEEKENQSGFPLKAGLEATLSA
jgi:hypothetical protein